MATAKGKTGTPPPPYLPVDWETKRVEVHALRALATGTATTDQQRAVLKFIIEDVCNTYDQPYRPGEGGERDTAFACGRMFAGQQIVKLLNMSLSGKPTQQAT